MTYLTEDIHAELKTIANKISIAGRVDAMARKTLSRHKKTAKITLTRIQNVPLLVHQRANSEK